MNTEIFTLHPRLAGDTHVVGDLALSRVLLMDDVCWRWLILVPRQPGLRELIDLATPDLHTLTDEIALASRVLQALFTPDKLNVGALGNVVEQLHVHVIARYADDPAWPAPVWGHAPPQRHAAPELAAKLDTLREGFVAAGRQLS